VKRMALAVLLLATPAFAADTPPQAAPPTVKLPAAMTTKVGAWIVVPADVDGGVPQWWLPDARKADGGKAARMADASPSQGLAEIPLASLFGDEWAAKARGRVFTSDVPGVFRVCAYNARGDVASLISTCVVTVEGVQPTPGPTPPGPTPPGPTPPGPAPIPGDGFRVLMVYETAGLSKLPPPQQAVLYSNEVRSYLNSHCVKGPDGKTAEFRIWDQNVNTASESKTWQDAMARPRKSVPWLIVSNPQKGGGWEGPLPSTVADAMKILTQFGG
jgi:hypothetical protein